MAKHRRKKMSAGPVPEKMAAPPGTINIAHRYKNACRLIGTRRYEEARRLFGEVAAAAEPELRALARNDLAVLDALAEDFETARRGFDSALALDPNCESARRNLAMLRSCGCLTPTTSHENGGMLKLIAEVDAVRNNAVEARVSAPVTPSLASPQSSVRVAILSFLFNWPSTGGGNVHTFELARFLTLAGYEVQHFYARFPDWGIGTVQAGIPIASEALEFDETTWNAISIQSSFRGAVDRFGPDYVIVADSWNMKPILAEAVADYPYFLRIQAQECLCPLNNLRLLATGPQTVHQCPRNQLANPETCRKCLLERGHQSGSLHQWERALAGVGTPEYDECLRRSLRDAEAALVLNPLIGALLEPYARQVHVIPWGMDTARFPWPPPDESGPKPENSPATLFMAAVAGEFIKGAHVAHEACRILRQSRSDFELVITSDPPGRIDEFTRSVGWCSQADLPRHYRAADVLLTPTIAQDGLSRTSVEAMASGIPVVASRIGGLPFTVVDGVTGLLANPGDPADLASQISKLLDDPALRRQMGIAGRRRFEQEFTWETVIERYYRPLFATQFAAAGRHSGREKVSG